MIALASCIVFSATLPCGVGIVAAGASAIVGALGAVGAGALGIDGAATGGGAGCDGAGCPGQVPKRLANVSTGETCCGIVAAGGKYGICVPDIAGNGSPYAPCRCGDGNNSTVSGGAAGRSGAATGS